MTQDLTERRYMRGADGNLYTFVDGAYRRADASESTSLESSGEVESNFWSRSDSLSARLLIDPGDVASSRLLIDPGDSASARLLIEPGDAQAGRLLVEPGELTAA